MKSRWRDDEADSMVERYASGRVSAATWLTSIPRVYWAGPAAGPAHGGGNTSVKTRIDDLSGEAVDALCVKGSGWDMAGRDRALYSPAVRIAPLFETPRPGAIVGREMVLQQRANLLTRPRPTRRSRRCCTPSCHTNSLTIPIDRDPQHRRSAGFSGDLHWRFSASGWAGAYIMPGFDLSKRPRDLRERSIGQRVWCC